MKYYLPETAIVPFTTIKRERVLHMPGEVLVRLGQRVSPDDVVARAVPLSKNLPLPQVQAQLWGEVVSILPRYGAVVETKGAFVQGKWGVGGCCHGVIKIVARQPDSYLTLIDIDESCRGCIIIGGSSMGNTALQRAVKLGVSGIVVGGIDAELLDKVGGCGIPIVLTEGFGDLPMVKPIFELLRDCAGCRATLSTASATKMNWRIIRPEIIIVRNETNNLKEISIFDGQEAKMGARVRVTRNPHYAQLGIIKSLATSTRKLDSGLEKEVAELELDNGKLVTVPLSNLELLGKQSISERR